MMTGNQPHAKTEGLKIESFGLYFQSDWICNFQSLEMIPPQCHNTTMVRPFYFFLNVLKLCIIPQPPCARSQITRLWVGDKTVESLFNLNSLIIRHSPD